MCEESWKFSKCPNCGSVYLSEFKFCPKCGHELDYKVMK